MNRIFVIILAVVVLVFGVVWYGNRMKSRAIRSGQAPHNQTASKTGPSGAAGTAQDQTAAQQQAPPDQAAPESQGPQGQTAGGTSDQSGSQQTQAPVVAPPPVDSISRNPPNGMIFAGTGKYQLYRQGDITWRLDTDTGQACILFATEAEWRKAQVYEHGCGAR